MDLTLDREDLVEYDVEHEWHVGTATLSVVDEMTIVLVDVPVDLTLDKEDVVEYLVTQESHVSTAAVFVSDVMTIDEVKVSVEWSVSTFVWAMYLVEHSWQVYAAYCEVVEEYTTSVVKVCVRSADEIRVSVLVIVVQDKHVAKANSSLFTTFARGNPSAQPIRNGTRQRITCKSFIFINRVSFRI